MPPGAAACSSAFGYLGEHRRKSRVKDPGFADGEDRLEPLPPGLDNPIQPGTLRGLLVYQVCRAPSPWQPPYPSSIPRSRWASSEALRGVELARTSA